MKQFEAVIIAMKENGGYATLGHLYEHVLKIDGVKWNTKTPFASIRRIVQDERFFFKIRPGLWALKDYKNKLPDSIIPGVNRLKNTEKTHTYYQGLLVEIGNLRAYETFVPNQDKNKKYLTKNLSEITSLQKIYQFSYDHIVRRAKTIDVVWFNERKMPDSFFEIEHSTNIQNSLLKFLDLEDFKVQFRIVADACRKNDYKSKISSSAFKPIADRVKFIDYDTISEWHSKIIAYNLIQNFL